MDADTHSAAAAASPTRWRWLRLGIAGRLALGLAAVAAVLGIAQGLTASTTREALDAVHSMQNVHERLASSAASVLEELVAYDRAVGEYVQEHQGAGAEGVHEADLQLQEAVADYFSRIREQHIPGTVLQLRKRLFEHVATASQLAGRAAQRAQWIAEREQALNRVYQRIASAGGSGLAINGTEVLARRSLADLATAINAVRGNTTASPFMARREQDFIAALNNHAAELEASPGRAWLNLVRADFAAAVRLRNQTRRYDQASGAQWHALLEDSAALTADIQEVLQRPAQVGLLQAAQHAAAAAEHANTTLLQTAAAVFVVLLLIFVLLVLSISLPVRRLTAATRRLASGERSVRAPQQGSAEVYELAESFNTMADRIERAEADLRAQQTELERHVAERTRQLQHLAHHDPLTQLPNRRQLADHLDSALARCGPDRRLGLLFVDVDNFKSINDTLGHSFGDRVLQQIAARLQAAAASGGAEFMARLGGDEFTVLLERAQSAAAVEKCAAQLVAALQQPLLVDGRTLTVSASIGASIYPDHAVDAEGLLRAADVALFRAKDLGRNRSALYNPALYDAAAQRFRLEQSLRRAVEQGELLLMYQPQVALHTCQVNGMEALLRWRKPDGRIAAAAEFIRVVEETGLIHELTGWVLRTAATAVAAWRAEGWREATVAVNVSAPQLLERGFVDTVMRTLELTRLPPSALELEITETVFQTGQATIESLRRLRQLGVSIALDDFGIGYSSLTSLEQLPITRVKLDRLLVAGVDSKPRTAAIVRSIVALCHGLGLAVVAEGVERTAQLEFLSHCGPIGVQGYLVAHPAEAAAAAAEADAASARTRLSLDAARQLGNRGSEALLFVNPQRRSS
ncbi:MAG: EAL domain-containing protein [Proteobacteria bacterium]|nr:EAL domain-containing protein [Pseudomonadota bacterium]